MGPRSQDDNPGRAAEVPNPPGGFVFIVTYGRSGSTVLQALLNTLPGYCIRGENANALYHLCRVVDGLDTATAAPGAAADDPWFGLSAIDRQALARRLFGLFVTEVLRLPEGTRVGGFKEIRYNEDLDFLPRQLALMEQHFPRARFLFLSRDPVEVSHSGWWVQWPPAEVMTELAAADRAFAAFAAGRANCFHLDHADLVPGSPVLKAMFDFLGEAHDEALVREVLARRLTHGRAPG